MPSGVMKRNGRVQTLAETPCRPPLFGKSSSAKSIGRRLWRGRKEVNSAGSWAVFSLKSNKGYWNV